MSLSIEDLLIAKHPLPQWVTVRELRSHVGYKPGERYIDVAAFDTWGKRRRIAYEVKRSRGDYVREMDMPDKRAWAEKHFHQCYFVTLPGVCAKEEVPEGWGLMVTTKRGDKLRTLRLAPPRDAEDIPWPGVLSLLRQQARAQHAAEERLATLSVAIDGNALDAKALEEWLEQRARERTDAHRKKLVSEQAALEKARRDLHRRTEGVMYLERRAAQWVGADTTVTRDMVDDMIAKLVARRLENSLSAMRTARQVLDRLLTTVQDPNEEDEEG